MISFPKLLLAISVSYLLVTSDHRIPSAPDEDDESAPLLGESASRSSAEDTALIRRENISSDIVLFDTKHDADIEALQVRDPPQIDWTTPNVRRRLDLAEKAMFFACYPFPLLAMINGCKQWKEDGKVIDGLLCVSATITTVWTTFLLLYKTLLGCYWGAHVANVFWSNWQASKRDIKAKRALDELSTLLGAEVRHLGFWNDTDASGTPNLKRSVEGDDEPSPVFGFESRGLDFHFVHRGEIDGEPVMRFGFGAKEDATDASTGSQKRDFNYYFEKGGLDFKFHPQDSLEKGWWKDNNEYWGWVNEQINCLLKEQTFWGSKPVDANGFFFQLYDNQKGTTVATAAMAVFGEDGQSAIGHMARKLKTGGLEVNRNCMDMGNFDIWG